MRILLSSKLLSTKLQEIDFEKESIEMVTLVNDELILTTQKSLIKFPVHPCYKHANESITQFGVRWDRIKKLLSQAEEQPIVLSISSADTNVIFQS